MKERIDTIVAAAAPAGGAVAVIRLSGPRAGEIAQQLTGKKPEKERTAELVNIKAGAVRDRAVLIYWKAPRSYTGEDVVELQCHGSPAVVREMIKSCIENGARQAERGEFTRRAVLSGKQDLMQAEATAELIGAQTAGQAAAAYAQLEGQGSREIKQAAEELAETAAEVSAAIDYPEEDLEEEGRNLLEKKIQMSLERLRRLQKSYENGRLVKDGIKVAIAGEPNAGKSTLLNTILGADRAIVTDIPGTTRDTLEESYEYKGQKFVFIDTAGLRDSDDRIEILGIERTKAALEGSDIVLFVTERNEKPDIRLPENKPVVFVRNKIDKQKEAGSSGKKPGTGDDGFLGISARYNINIEALKERIFAAAKAGEIAEENPMIGSPRQYGALQRAITALENARENLGSVTMDCITTDLEEAIEALGDITGATASEEIIDKIFEKFCVGK